MGWSRVITGALAVALLGAGLATAAQAEAPEPSTEPISTTASGVLGFGPSTPEGMSSDGRYVLYSSAALNLAPDENVEDEIQRTGFVLRDRATGENRMLNWLPNDTYLRTYPGGSLTASGRYALLTTITAAVAGDTNRTYDAYLRDLQTDEISRVSVADDEAQLPYGAFGQGLSADGRHVLFTGQESAAAPVTGVWVRDRARGRTFRMDVATAGVVSDASAIGAAISPNGRWVTFASYATTLAPDQALCEEWVWDEELNEEKAVPRTCADVFLHDRDPDGDGVFDEAGTTTVLVSRNGAGDQAAGDTSIHVNSVSNSGDVVLHAQAPNLGPNGLYVRGHDGSLQFIAPGDRARITPDGRHVTFSSGAADLVPGDDNGLPDAFLHDRSTGVTERVSVFADGAGSEHGAYESLPSPDGRFVAFASQEGGSMHPSNQSGVLPSQVYLRFRGGEAPVEGTASQPVTGGESVTTDPDGAGATPQNPVQTAITVPDVEPGTVTVTPQPPTPIPGFSVFGKEVVISAPAATATDPYVATFTIDAATLAGMAPSNIQVFRNGSVVGTCTSPTDAVPNPCVAARGLVPGGGGDAFVTVRTTQFSTWSFGRNRAPKVSGAYASPTLLKTADATMRTITIKGVTDADKNKVTIKVTKVTQDEKVGSKPDATLVSTPGQVKLRAERSSTGNGRVYKVHFTATDSYGAKTTGSVKITVRRSSTKAAVDSGQKYTSTKAS